MSGLIIVVARGALLVAVALSAIVSMYEATNAVAVYTNHSVFSSGLMMVFAGALVNPLFCFIASYGLLRYENLSLGVTLTLTLPACIGWCFVAARGLLSAATR